MSLLVKICGVTDLKALKVSVDSGVDYLGFVFFPKSPRNISTALYSALASETPKKVAKVGLFVNPNDHLIDQVLSISQLDYIQLHGNETPNRISSIRKNFLLPIIK